MFQSHIGPISTRTTATSTYGGSPVSIPYWSDFNILRRWVVPGWECGFQSHIGPISTGGHQPGHTDLGLRFNPILVRFQQRKFRIDPAREIGFNPILVRFQLGAFYEERVPQSVSIPYWSDFNAIGHPEAARAASEILFQSHIGPISTTTCPAGPPRPPRFNPILVRFQQMVDTLVTFLYQ